MTEKFEDVTVLGHPMLFTCLRVDRDTVPQGMYLYEVRHDDDQQGEPVQIANWIMVNHWGTLISNRPIRLEPRPELFLLDGRNIRRKISALRQDGFPICSDETGYYYADNQKEINTTVCRLNELVTKVSNARTGLLFASILGENAQTVEVTIKVR